MNVVRLDRKDCDFKGCRGSAAFRIWPLKEGGEESHEKNSLYACRHDADRIRDAALHIARALYGKDGRVRIEDLDKKEEIDSKVRA